MSAILPSKKSQKKKKEKIEERKIETYNLPFPQPIKTIKYSFSELKKIIMKVRI